MPCQTVTVSGPEADTTVSFQSTDIQGGQNEASATYSIVNNGNVEVIVDIEFTINGSQEATNQHRLSPGQSTSGSFNASFDVSAGRQRDVTVCVNNIGSAPAFQ